MDDFLLISAEQVGAVDTAFTIPAGSFTLSAVAPTFATTVRFAVPAGGITFSASAPTFQASHLGLTDGALSRGAHLKLGEYELMIDEAVEGHYSHHWQTILADQQTIPGQPDKRNVRQEKLLWSFDDWSGGEGNKIYYPDDPTVYSTSGGANGRVRGELTGRPSRTKGTVATGDKSQPAYMANALGKTWIVGYRSIHYSDDGVTYTAHSQNSAPTITGVVTAVAGDHDYLYVASWDSGAGKRYLYRVTASAITLLITGGETAANGKFRGIDVYNGSLYGWTGRKLIQYDVFETPPLTADQYHKAYDSGVDITDAGSWADITTGGNALFMLAGTQGRTSVFRYFRGGGGEIWQPGDTGFTGKTLVFKSGNLFCLGHFGPDSAGKACIYALPLDSLRELFIGWVRRGGLHQLQGGSPSYGAQIMAVAPYNGLLVIYDMEFDAISLLDDIDDLGTYGDSPQHKVSATITFGRRRIAVTFVEDAAGGTSGNYTFYSYADDEPDNREDDIAMPTVTSGTWDLGFPNERKVLIGFHVTFEPLTTGQTIDLSYSLDAAGWVSLPQITTTTAGATDGRVFLLASSGTSTKNFFNMQFRIDAAGTGSGKLPPIIFGCTPESALLAKVEMWDLVVRIKDEAQTTGRPAGRSVRAEDLRGYLETLIQNQAIVTYLDNYRYQRRPGTYSRHTVMVLEGDDRILRNAEGSMSLRLMAISET